MRHTMFRTHGVLVVLALLVAGCGDKSEEDDTGSVVDTTPTDDTSTLEDLDADDDGFETDTDCDDTDAAINPDAEEICDGIDNDCDDLIDDDDESLTDGDVWYPDDDGDGFGASEGENVCEAGEGWSDNDADCDDTNSAVNPDAEEECDGGNTDEDCDGLINDEDDSTALSSMSTFYSDADGDGFGDPDSPVMACEPGSSLVPNNEDCYDGNADANPVDGCWNGGWSGDFTASVAIDTIGTDVCKGTLGLDVSMSESPMIDGSGSCTMALLGTLTATLEGNIDNTDVVTGTLDIGGIISDDWTGTVSDTGFTGSADGKSTYLGFDFTYSVEFELARD
ncbi:MAG: hypothetical protein ACI8RZ_001164 [Myxococcota bacterium]|jgi:hypothetical protein